MKKLFIVTLAVLFFAGAAYAVDYDYSGMLNTRGSYIDNSGSTSNDSYDYMYYDMEFDSTLIIRPSDQSFIRLNMEIHDNNFNQSPESSQDLTGKGEDDDQIAWKRAWGQYNFANGWSTAFGLMTGGAFGTSFGDNADGYYRVRADAVLDFGKIGFILEKGEENGNLGDADWDAEADDSDAYAAYLVTKVGDVTLMFLGKYAQVGNATPLTAADQDDPLGFEDEGSDIDVIAGVAAATGSFGDIGFEAEAMFKDYTMEGDDVEAGGVVIIEDNREDYTVYGLYGNVWMNMDAMKIGGLAAYGSYDDDGEAGFGFGEDFGPGFWVMDWDAFGSGNAEYYAATLVSLYADYAVSDALSFYGAFEYMWSNEEDTEWDGAKGYILNASMTYKLADNVTYSVAGAYGKYSDGEWLEDPADPDSDYDDPDAFARVFHKIQINF